MKRIKDEWYESDETVLFLMKNDEKMLIKLKRLGLKVVKLVVNPEREDDEAFLVQFPEIRDISFR